MNASRPKKVVALPDAPDTAGLSGFLLKHLNTISTVILLIVAIVLFVRWRLRSAENARILLGNDLSTAQVQVAKIRNGRFPEAQSPADTIKALQAAETQASGAISDVLNASDADVSMRAAR